MRASTKILLIDSNAVLDDALQALFARHGEFAIERADCLAKALEVIAASTPPDIILLTDEIGPLETFCAALIKTGYKVPILLLVGANNIPSAERLNQLGAHDAIARPFRFGVFVARLRSLLRNHEMSDDAILRIGPYHFRSAEKLIYVTADAPIKLTDKEAAILKSLHRARERPVTRETLLGDVWGYNSGVTTHTLETHIYRLRQKIESKGEEPIFLLTDTGGYLLMRG